MATKPSRNQKINESGALMLREKRPRISLKDTDEVSFFLYVRLFPASPMTFSNIPFHIIIHSNH